jgi:hypothetical protein
MPFHKTVGIFSTYLIKKIDLGCALVYKKNPSRLYTHYLCNFGFFSFFFYGGDRTPANTSYKIYAEMVQYATKMVKHVTTQAPHDSI